MIAQTQIARYLFDSGFISPRNIVDCDFVVMGASCRNQNFRTVSTNGRSYFLKQGATSDAIATVAHEACVYRFLSESPDAAKFMRFVPSFVEYDSDQRVLILESVSDGHDIREYLYRTGRFPIWMARKLGTALSLLHRITTAGLETARAYGLEPRLPWILSIHRPGLSLFHQSSAVSVEIIRIVQNAGDMAVLLDEVKAGWRTDALIHHDVKWDNCLVAPRQTADTASSLKLIDWELANLGDPCWDIGAVFASFLSSWLLSIPASGQHDPEHYLPLAQYPIQRFHRAIRAFWQAYVIGKKLNNVESSTYLIRAVRYAAARLLQIAFEQTQHASSLCSNIVCLLQLSSNIFERPEEAVDELLGLQRGMKALPR